jgi:hypothetical protein
MLDFTCSFSWFPLVKLKSSLWKVYDRHLDLVNSYEIYVS